jgi:hypothetical protein
MTDMSKCEYHQCRDQADGRFLLAPSAGAFETDSAGYFDEHRPLQLCHWHALLVGDQRVPDRDCTRA